MGEKKGKESKRAMQHVQYFSIVKRKSYRREREREGKNKKKRKKGNISREG